MDESKIRWPIVFEVAVAWGEMDAFAHVNNIVYLRWFESARIAFFEKTGVLDKMESDGIGPILAKTTIDYKKPVTYPDKISISVRLGGIGNSSFTLIFRANNLSGDLVAHGENVIVMIDYRSHKKVALTEIMKRRLTEI